jgi:hypothetical protein
MLLIVSPTGQGFLNHEGVKELQQRWQEHEDG